MANLRMAKTKALQTDVQPSNRPEDIPPHVDMFLRMLARWTVEEMHRRLADEAQQTRTGETSND